MIYGITFLDIENSTSFLRFYTFLKPVIKQSFQGLLEVFLRYFGGHSKISWMSFKVERIIFELFQKTTSAAGFACKSSRYLVFWRMWKKRKKTGPWYTCMQLCLDILACKFNLLPKWFVNCNFYFWVSVSKITRLLVFMNIFKTNSLASISKYIYILYILVSLPCPNNLWKCETSDPFILACKCVRIYLHASLSGGNTKRGK